MYKKDTYTDEMTASETDSNRISCNAIEQLALFYVTHNIDESVAPEKLASEFVKTYKTMKKEIRRSERINYV